MPGMHFRPSPFGTSKPYGQTLMKGLTEEEYRAFLKENPDGLRYVPKRARTADMCLYAMECNGYSDINVWIKDCWQVFEYFPEELFTEESCAIFLDTGFKDERETEYKLLKTTPTGSIRVYDYYKWIIKWESLRKKALAIDPLFIMALPKREITQEYCDIAFLSCPTIIKVIPDKFKNIEMCRAAYKYNEKLTKYIPEDCLSQDIKDAIESKKNAERDAIEERARKKEEAHIAQIKAFAPTIESYRKSLHIPSWSDDNKPKCLLIDFSTRTTFQTDASKVSELLNEFGYSLRKRLYSTGYKWVIDEAGQLSKVTREEEYAMTAVVNDCSIVVMTPMENLTHSKCNHATDLKIVLAAVHRIAPECRIIVFSNDSTHYDFVDSSEFISDINELSKELEKNNHPNDA